jgi:hypothetical protein
MLVFEIVVLVSKARFLFAFFCFTSSFYFMDRTLASYRKICSARLPADFWRASILCVNRPSLDSHESHARPLPQPPRLRGRDLKPVRLARVQVLELGRYSFLPNDLYMINVEIHRRALIDTG